VHHRGVTVSAFDLHGEIDGAVRIRNATDRAMTGIICSVPEQRMILIDLDDDEAHGVGNIHPHFGEDHVGVLADEALIDPRFLPRALHLG